MESESIKYYKAKEVGEGKSFAYVNYQQLISKDDIFSLSLRDFHVIFWVKKGSGHFFLDFKEHAFEPNTLILLSKDQAYQFKPFDIANTEIVSIPFKPEFLYKSNNDIKHLFNFSTLKHSKGESNTLKVNKTSAIKFEKICAEMAELYNNSETHKAEIFYHYLCIFLIYCDTLLNEQQPSSTPLTDDDLLIMQFNKLLEENFKKEFNVAFYADQLNITNKVLSKLTKKYHHLSPKAVIDERRILEIKRLLKGTSKSGKTIAVELNFDEPTNMFKFFKKHVGLTPNEFKGK